VVLDGGEDAARALRVRAVEQAREPAAEARGVLGGAGGDGHEAGLGPVEVAEQQPALGRGRVQLERVREHACGLAVEQQARHAPRELGEDRRAVRGAQPDQLGHEELRPRT
jgi:hypothetical protein